MTTQTSDHTGMGRGMGNPDTTQEDHWREFGAALTWWLNRCGKTQTVVAKEIGVSTSTVSAWKQGQAEPDRPQTTYALELAVGAPAGELSRHLNYIPPSAAATSWEQSLLGLDPCEVDDTVRQAIHTVVEAIKKLR